MQPCDECGAMVPLREYRVHLSSCAMGASPAPCNSATVSVAPCRRQKSSVLDEMLQNLMGPLPPSRQPSVHPLPTTAPTPLAASSARQLCNKCGKVATSAHRCADPFEQRGEEFIAAKCPYCRKVIDPRYASVHLASCCHSHLRNVGVESAVVRETPQILCDRLYARSPPPEPANKVLAGGVANESTESVAIAPPVATPAALPACRNDIPALHPEEIEHLRLCVLCRKPVRKDEFMEHLGVCPENLRSCEYCLEGVAVCRYDDHLATCNSNTRECFVCHKCIPLHKVVEHVEQCSSAKPIIMFHGTSLESAQSILRHGFEPSVRGMLGAGVYVTRDVQKAANYGAAILEVKVNPGRVVVINKKGHNLQKCWHARGYDSAWIPAKCGVTPSGLEEHCIFDPRRTLAVRLISSNVTTSA